MNSIDRTCMIIIKTNLEPAFFKPPLYGGGLEGAKS